MDVMRHNRYAVYRLKGRQIDAKVPRKLGGYSISGIVTSVFRDVLDNQIKLVVKNKTFLFDEPDSICETGDRILFVYGQHDDADVSDDDLFDEMRRIAGKGGSVDDAMKNLESGRRRVGVIEIVVGDKQDEKKVTRRSKRGKARSSTGSSRTAPGPKHKGGSKRKGRSGKGSGGKK